MAWVAAAGAVAAMALAVPALGGWNGPVLAPGAPEAAPSPATAAALLAVAPAEAGTAEVRAAPPEPPAEAPATADDAPPPQGQNLTQEELQELAAWFDDEPLLGGQVQPRVVKWVNEDVLLFLQFDAANPANAKELRYVGLGLRSSFCAETQPDAAQGSWPHFHRRVAPLYSLGHGTVPGAEGFWLTWLSVLPANPGIQYTFAPTPPSACVALHELPALLPGGEAPASDELAALADLFFDAPFGGGQASPWRARWVNEEAFVFLELEGDPAAPEALLGAGMGLRGRFCAEGQPTADFPHFRRWSSLGWDDSAGGAAGSWGYWMARLGTANAGAADLGIDRAFDPTPAPEC